MSFQAPKKLLVLQFLVSQTNQRLECDLVPKRMSATEVGDLGTNEAFDQREHVGIGTALYVRIKALLIRAQERQLVDLRQSVGQKLLAEIEFPAAYQIAVDIPANTLRDFDALGIALCVNG